MTSAATIVLTGLRCLSLTSHFYFIENMLHARSIQILHFKHSQSQRGMSKRKTPSPTEAPPQHAPSASLADLLKLPFTEKVYDGLSDVVMGYIDSCETARHKFCSIRDACRDDSKKLPLVKAELISIITEASKGTLSELKLAQLANYAHGLKANDLLIDLATRLAKLHSADRLCFYFPIWLWETNSVKNAYFAWKLGETSFQESEAPSGKDVIVISPWTTEESPSKKRKV